MMKKRGLRQVKINQPSTAFFILLFALWAASPGGAAAFSRAPKSAGGGSTIPMHITAQSSSVKGAATRVNAVVPCTVRFREVEGRGLLVKMWINRMGAYTFAIDTGAGATILSRRVAADAQVSVINSETFEIRGLSSADRTVGRKATLRELAIGDRHNRLTPGGAVIVVDELPPGIDGVLDPTEAFRPFGYVINISAGVLSAFDPSRSPLHIDGEAGDGVIVPWLRETRGRRPFVMIEGGRRALLDTGSGLGLAVSETAARALRIAVPVSPDESGRKDDSRDFTGAAVRARRIRPATVFIGALALRHVPTDLLLGVEAETPILLGRDALRPFQITFDSVNRLIQLKPVSD